MGATDFTATAEGATAEEAFRAARAEALHMYGHGGYTGSIAEKDGHRVFRLPAGLSVREAVRLLRDYGWDNGQDREAREIWPSITQAADTFGDKWGPAVALQEGPTTWTFCGIAAE